MKIDCVLSVESATIETWAVETFRKFSVYYQHTQIRTKMAELLNLYYWALSVVMFANGVFYSGNR